MIDARVDTKSIANPVLLGDTTRPPSFRLIVTVLISLLIEFFVFSLGLVVGGDASSVGVSCLI